MTTSELEQVVRDYIMDIYKKQYIGKIKIKELNPGYCIHMELGGLLYAPLVIYAELEDDKFLKFLREDLKTRNFHFASYGSLNLTYPDNCEPINTACSCNDKGRINR